MARVRSPTPATRSGGPVATQDRRGRIGVEVAMAGRIDAAAWDGDAHVDRPVSVCLAGVIAGRTVGGLRWRWACHVVWASSIVRRSVDTTSGQRARGEMIMRVRQTGHA